MTKVVVAAIVLLVIGSVIGGIVKLSLNSQKLKVSVGLWQAVLTFYSYLAIYISFSDRSNSLRVVHFLYNFYSFSHTIDIHKVTTHGTSVGNRFKLYLHTWRLSCGLKTPFRFRENTFYW